MDALQNGPPRWSPSPGQQIGPYVVLGRLGQGGMGQVFLASDSRLRRKVALKQLFAALKAEDTVRTTVLREAEAVARITHQNVAMVYDVIEHDDHTFIVMEYVEGETLSARLARERLPGPMVTRFGRQLCAGLAAAHANGIVHRDLKPSNIQVTPQNHVKILDFGVAKVSELLSAVTPTTASPGPVAAHLEETAARTTAIGTPGYMSPEQMLGHAVGPLSDLFSLGVVLFEMAVGQRLFTETDAGRIAAATARPLPRADTIDPTVSSGLSDIIASLIDADPKRRIQSAREIDTRLAELESATGSDRLAGRFGTPASRLKDLKRRLVQARADHEVVRLKYEVEAYLAECPHDLNALALKNDIERALRSGPPARTLTAPPPTLRLNRMWSAIGALVVVATITGYVLYRNTVPPSSEPRLTGPPTSTVAPATVPPALPSTVPSSVARPAGVTARENPGGVAESSAGLSLPSAGSDAVGQRGRSNQVPEALAPGPTPAGVSGEKPVAATAATPDTLMVQAREGEQERERSNRQTAALTHLNDGKRAISERRYDLALSSLNAAITISGRTDFGSFPGEAAALLQQAQQEKGQADAVAEARAVPDQPVVNPVQIVQPAARSGSSAGDLRFSAVAGFTIDYPRRDWTIIPAVGTWLVTFVHTSGEATVGVERIQMQIALAARDITEQTAHLEIEDWKQRRRDATQFSYQFIDYQGERTILIDFKQDGARGAEHVRLYTIPRGTDKYRVLGTTVQESFNRYKETIHRMAMSLKPTSK